MSTDTRTGSWVGSSQSPAVRKDTGQLDCGWTAEAVGSPRGGGEQGSNVVLAVGHGK